MNAAQIKTAQNMLTGMIGHRDAMRMALETPKADDTILAWPTGLAVHMVDGKTPAVGGPLQATAFRAGDTGTDFAFPVIGNGKNEFAVPRLRRAVLIQAIEQANEAIEVFENGLKLAQEGQ